jgi:putative flippase GtrA
MNQRHALIGFIATLVTLVLVLVTTFLAAYYVPQIIGKIEAFGIGTVTGGLITLAASFRPRSPQDTQP